MSIRIQTKRKNHVAPPRLTSSAILCLLGPMLHPLALQRSQVNHVGVCLFERTMILLLLFSTWNTCTLISDLEVQACVSPFRWASLILGSRWHALSPTPLPSWNKNTLLRQSFPQKSRGTFPILSRDPSFQKPPETQGKWLVIEKNDG